jgi:GTPase involved in cell partitioning and DNA repair
MFVDKADITVVGGRGGNGCSSRLFAQAYGW